jgi:hypothetical protein
MKIEFNGVESADLTLQYGSTLIDQIGFGATIVGTVMYILVFVILFRHSKREKKANRQFRKMNGKPIEVRMKEVEQLFVTFINTL